MSVDRCGMRHEEDETQKFLREESGVALSLLR
jgi:hypothetical protein